MAVFNSGSIRLDDVLTGTITDYDILRSFPFGGGISLIDLKGEVIEKILEIGTVQNAGIGDYLQLANAEKRAGQWYIKNERLNSSQTYTLALPEFVMGGGEANLEFLAQHESQAKTPQKFGKIKNDVRAIIMHYFKRSFGNNQTQP